jgi:hypothetical protein
MEKRLFNKIIKQQMLSYGFEKTGALEYAKEAQDGITKVIVLTPDQTFGFGVGVQFKDYGGYYNGKIAKNCMACSKFSLVLRSAESNDYSEEEIIAGVEKVMNGLEPLLQKGKERIRETIKDWAFGLTSQRIRREILLYLGLPAPDPYSEEYLASQVEDHLKCGGMTTIGMEEYEEHKEFYDLYKKYGCQIVDYKDYVMITYDYSSNEN